MPARLRVMTPEAEAKASLKRASESAVADAKPSDLPLTRLKAG